MAGAFLGVVGVGVLAWWMRLDRAPATLAARVARVETAIPPGVHAACVSASLHAFGKQLGHETFTDGDNSSDALRYSGNLLLLAALELLGVGSDLDQRRLDRQQLDRVHAVFRALRAPAAAATRVREDGRTVDRLLVVDVWDGGAQDRWSRLVDAAAGHPLVDVPPLVAPGAQLTQHGPAGGPPVLFVGQRAGYYVLATSADLAVAACERLGADSDPIGTNGDAPRHARLPPPGDAPGCRFWAAGPWLRRQLIQITSRDERAPDDIATKVDAAWNMTGLAGVEWVTMDLALASETLREELAVGFDPNRCAEFALRSAPAPAPSGIPEPEPDACEWVHLDWAGMWPAWERWALELVQMTGAHLDPARADELRRDYGRALFPLYVGPCLSWSWTLSDEDPAVRVGRIAVRDPEALRKLFDGLEPTATESIGSDATMYVFGRTLRTPVLMPGFRWLPGPFLGMACAVDRRYLYGTPHSDRARDVLRRAIDLVGEEGLPEGTPTGSHSQARWVRRPSARGVNGAGSVLWFVDAADSGLSLVLSRLRFMLAAKPALKDLRESLDVLGTEARLVATAGLRDLRSR